MGWNFPMQVNNCKRVSEFKSPYRDCQVSCKDRDTTTAVDLKPISESLWVLKTLTLCFPRDTPQLSMFIQTSVWLFFSALNYSCSSIFFFLWELGRGEGYMELNFNNTERTGRKRRPSSPGEHGERVQIQLFLFSLQSLEIHQHKPLLQACADHNDTFSMINNRLSSLPPMLTWKNVIF